MFLSIIMPTYKTPTKYVKRMINSIKKQTSTNYELIIVDDGSGSDYCEELEKLCCEIDEGIRLIRSEHKGVSATRNIGIECAQGEYISFVDADDTVSLGFVKEAYDYIQKYNADIIYGCLEMDGNDCKQSDDKIKLFHEKEIEEVAKCLINIRPREETYRVLGSPCARIYRSSLVKQIGFVEGLGYCEDFIFNREVLQRTNLVMIVPNVWYHYYMNDFSAMNKKVKENYFEMARPYWDELYRLNSGISQEMHDGVCEMSLRLYYSAVIEGILNRDISIEQKISEMKEIADHKLFQQSISELKFSSKYLSLSRKLELILLKTKCFFLLYKLIELNRKEKK